MWERRLLVVEDEPLMSSLLCQVLGQAGFQTQACPDAVSVRKAVHEFDPDGALIDIHLGNGPSGLHVGQLLHRTHPHMALLFLTKHHDPRVAEPRGIGVPPGSAFLSKDLISETQLLTDAIERAFAQQGLPRRDDLTNHNQLSVLTNTQLETLRLAAAGLTNAGIAKARGTNERTIEQRLQAACRALDIPVSPDINRRVEAVRRYIAVAGIPHLVETRGKERT